MRYILAYLRAAIIILFIPPVLIIYLIRGLWMGYGVRQGLTLRTGYLKLINPLLGIRTHLYGQPSTEPTIYVANHRSLIDPFVIVRYIPCLPVSKAEVARYPIFGFGARVTGVIYVDRGDKASRKSTRELMREYVQKGHAVLIFPEGTTHAEDTVGKFYMGAFEVAAEANLSITPITLEYHDREDRWRKGESLSYKFTYSLGKYQTPVDMYIHPSIRSTDPAILENKSRDWMNTCIKKTRHRLENHD